MLSAITIVIVLSTLPSSSSMKMRRLEEHPSQTMGEWIKAELSKWSSDTEELTATPTQLPTVSPSSTPTCVVSLPDNLTSLAIVNLQFRLPDEDRVNTESVINQLTEIFKESYNRIIDVQYSPCDDAYRQVISVKQIDVSENSNSISSSTASSSFAFRRQLAEGQIDQNAQFASIGGNSSPKTTTHYLRIGRSSEMVSSQETRMLAQEGNDWIYFSYLFEVIVGCSGIFCIGDDAELFTDDFILSDAFSQVYASNVAETLILEPTVFVDTVREIEEQSCPTGDQNITKNIIAQLVLDSSTNITELDDPRLDLIEEAYVSTYNNMIRNELCDPNFRRLTDATVVAVKTETKQNNETTRTILSLEMRINMKYKGRDLNDIDIFTNPSVLFGPNSNSSSSGRYLMENTMITRDISTNDEWLLPSATTFYREGRSMLDQSDISGKCYCVTQSSGNRAPIEAEFYTEFAKAVDRLNIDGIPSAGSCQLPKSFSTGLVIAFPQQGFKELVESTEDVKRILENALKETLNDLLAITNENCNTDFRVVEDVAVIIAFNITSNYTYQINDQNLQLSNNTGVPLTSGNDRRNLQEASSGQWERPMVRIVNGTNSSLNTSESSTLGTNTTSSENNAIDSIGTADETNFENVTSNPLDPLALDSESNDIVPVIFFIKGFCTDCSNSLTNGLTNDAFGRRLREASPTPSPSMQPPFYRDLLDDEEEIAKSDCFCPLNATQASEQLDADAILELFEREIEDLTDIEIEAEIVGEVDIIDCNDKTSFLSVSGACTVIENEESPNDINNTTNSPVTSNSTAFPSTGPTAEPTDSPTPEPTRQPTRQPTPEPTRRPTRQPTSKPTSKPTLNPTNVPTDIPSNMPSICTEQPTVADTSGFSPICVPTGNPSESPTKVPSQSPTGNPSEGPTTEPTEMVPMRI